MGHVHPVCDTPQHDETHLADHLTLQVIIHDDDHGTQLGEHALEWANPNIDSLDLPVTDLAEERGFDKVFEDTVDRMNGPGYVHPHEQEHDHDIPNRQLRLFGGAGGSKSPLGDAARIFEEAQSLTRKMVADNDENGKNGEHEDVPRDGDDTRGATDADDRGKETDGADRKKSQTRTPSRLVMEAHGTTAPASLDEVEATFDRVGPTAQAVVCEAAKVMEFDREEYSECVTGDVTETIQNALFAESLSVTVDTRTESGDWRSTHEEYAVVELGSSDMERVARHAVPSAETVLTTAFQSEKDTAVGTPRRNVFGRVHRDALLGEEIEGDDDASAGVDNDIATDAAGTNGNTTRADQ